MVRHAWKAVVRHGMIGEYTRRHDEIWPEMKAKFEEAGIHNYSIWNVGNELFGYYECDDPARAAEVPARAEVSKKWNEYMKDCMYVEVDSATMRPLPVKQVFLHE